MIHVEALQRSLSSITIDTQEKLTKDYFNENYGYPGIPVLFKSAFQDMPIKNKWTTDYLAGNLKEKEQMDNIRFDGTRKYLTLDEYLADDSPAYYYKTSRHLVNSLTVDYVTPPLFNCWYANTTAGNPISKLSWLYVGKRSTFSEMHRDIWWSSAWNYLVSGLKLWFIYPPVYNESLKAKLDAYSLKQLLENTDTICEKEYKPLICLQQSGELVFVPGNYYHAVYNVEPTVSLTENFINETNYDMVRSYFRTKPNKKNLHSIEAIIKEGFEKNNF